MFVVCDLVALSAGDDDETEAAEGQRCILDGRRWACHCACCSCVVMCVCIPPLCARHAHCSDYSILWVREGEGQRGLRPDAGRADGAARFHDEPERSRGNDAHMPGAALLVWWEVHVLYFCSSQSVEAKLERLQAGQWMCEYYDRIREVRLQKKSKQGACKSFSIDLAVCWQLSRRITEWSLSPDCKLREGTVCGCSD
jgi:hypothetical protein